MFQQFFSSFFGKNAGFVPYHFWRWYQPGSNYWCFHGFDSGPNLGQPCEKSLGDAAKIWVFPPKWNGENHGKPTIFEWIDLGGKPHYFWKHTYCWWKKSCTTLDVWNPVNNGIFTISTGAGFFPSTVFLSNFVEMDPFLETPLHESAAGKSSLPDISSWAWWGQRAQFHGGSQVIWNPTPPRCCLTLGLLTPPMETPYPPFMTPLGPKKNRWFWHPMTSHGASGNSEFTPRKNAGWKADKQATFAAFPIWVKR